MSKILAGADGLLPKKSMRLLVRIWTLSNKNWRKGEMANSSMHPIPSVILWVGATRTLNRAFLIRGAFSVSPIRAVVRDRQVCLTLVAWQTSS